MTKSLSFVCLLIALLLIVVLSRPFLPGLTLWPRLRAKHVMQWDDKPRVATTSLLTIPQRELAEYMMELSEEAYCAEWMQNLEHILWSAVQNGPIYWGRLDITEEHIAKI